jgi:lysophospholipase L1-like esterase
LEVSPDSTDGADGTWSVVARNAAVTTHAAAHLVAFVGMRWLKLVVTGAPRESPNGVQIDELEVHDATASTSDTWFFSGDSITAFAFGRYVPQGLDFSSLVHARHKRYWPAIINGGIGGETSADGLRHVEERLRQNPDAHVWGIAYGTNDAAGSAHDTTRFRENLGAIVNRLLGAGKLCILATIPFANDGAHDHVGRFNDAIDEVRRAAGLPRGPDLYAWFAAHPEELRDGIHPDARGIASINRLWAEAVNALYRP